MGDDYPLFIKMGVQDGFDGGLEFGEGKTAARIISKWGFDALEISQGLRGKEFEGTEFRTNIRNKDREAYFREWTKVIKEDVNVPVMMVGGLRTFELIKEVVDKKETDFISLCRPFIREPGIVNDWKSGNYHKATCISCNGSSSFAWIPKGSCWENSHDGFEFDSEKDKIEKEVKKTYLL